MSVHIRGIGPDGQWLTKAERNDMSGDAIARLEAWKSASKHRGCSVYHTDSYDSTGWCCSLAEGVGDTARRVNLISGPDDDWGYSMTETINRALDAWEAGA